MKATSQNRSMSALIVLFLFLALVSPVIPVHRAEANEPTGWYQQESGTSEFLADVSTVDASTAWASGSNCIVLKTSNGDNWSTQHKEDISSLYGISAVNTDRAWAVGYNGKILKTTNGGLIWTPQTSGVTETLNAVSAVDANTAWAVGGGSLGYDSIEVILHTTNGGATWTIQKLEIGQLLWDVEGIDANNAWVVGNGGTILKTTDGGTTWNPQDSGIITPLYGVSAVDANTAWAVGKGSYLEETRVILKTSDGGVTWNEQLSEVGSVLYGVSAVDHNNAWAVGHEGSILKTSDGGSTWNIQISGTEKNLLGVSAVDASTAWAVGEQGAILHTTSGGGELSWYMAEGCTMGGFETWILVQNPGGDPVHINMEFHTDSGLVQGPQETISPRSRKTYNVGDYVSTYHVSTKVTPSGGEIICERAMYGGDRTWGHDSIGATTLSEEWYLAEGCTRGGFETWVLVQNPTGEPVDVNMEFYSGSEQVEGPKEQIPPYSRRSYDVADYVSSYEVSTKVTASRASIICERAMYGGGRTWGHSSIGSIFPSRTWYLAEGCTMGGFETWVLVQNVEDREVTLEIDFQTDEGEVQGPREKMPANSRRTYNASDYVHTYHVSTRVHVPEWDNYQSPYRIICERAVYGKGRTWGHDSIGARGTSDTWYLAEGCTEGGFETWILVQNPSGEPVDIDMRFQTESGEVQGPKDSIPANSRSTYNVGDYASTYHVSTKVIATDDIICERAMYGNNRTWGHDSIGWPEP